MTLEQVYGAITYYLADCESIDAYLEDQQDAFKALKDKLKRIYPQMSQRIVEMKQQRRATQA